MSFIINQCERFNFRKAEIWRSEVIFDIQGLLVMRKGLFNVLQLFKFVISSVSIANNAFRNELVFYHGPDSLCL